MSSNHPTRGTHRATVAGLMLALALLFLATATTRAEATPVTVTFDNGRLDIGSIFKDRVVLPATDKFPSDSLPTPQRTDIQLIGDETGGKVTIPAALNSGLQFPYMHLMHPLKQDLMIPVTMRLNDPGLTGTWDAASGAMTLAGKVDLVVVTGQGKSFPLPDSLDDLAVPPLGLFARCRVNDLPVEFSTATKSPITAEPFTGGFGKHGAITTSWQDLPEAVSENGGDCAQLDTMIHAPGGLWLSNGIVDPIPQEVPAETCATNPRLCPPPTFALIDEVRVSPRQRAVKPGQKVRLKITVHNSGNAPATGQPVAIRASNRKVKAPARISLDVPANGSASRSITVKVRRGTKGRSVIRAAAEGWDGTATLKIKSKRKPRHRR